MSSNNIQSIQFNTLFRDGGDLSNPVWNNLRIDDMKGYRVKNLAIPLSVKTFDSRNNQLSFQNTNGTFTVTIPEGYYNSSSLPSILQSELNNASTSGSFSVSYINLTNTLQITNTLPFIWNTSIVNNGYYELGLENYSETTFSSVGNSSNQIDLGGPSVLNIVSNLGKNRIAGSQKRLLSSIILNESNLELATFENHSSLFNDVDNDELNELNITLFDNRMRQITPSKDWQISLDLLIE
jgi:hypothetical protein